MANIKIFSLKKYEVNIRKLLGFGGEHSGTNRSARIK